MMFRRHNGGVVGLSSEALCVIRRHLQLHPHTPEAGGILLGRRIAFADDIVIDRVTEPASTDRRSRFRFVRARRPAQAIVDAAWHESGGSVNYLGDWHTHPEPIPSPSCIDLYNWRRLVRKTRFEGDCLIFLIAGTQSLGLWEVNNSLETVLLGTTPWQ